MTGDGFPNNVVAGEGKLIATYIQSPNYVAGVSGWAIFKDGTAEFNDATIRATLIIGTPPTGPGIEISPIIPAELVTYYSTHYSAVVTEAYIRMQPNANVYRYMVVCDESGFEFYAEGIVDTGVVKEGMIQAENPLFGGSFNVSYAFGHIEGVAIAFGSAAIGAQTSLAQVFQTKWEWNADGDAASDRLWNGTSLPRGKVSFNQYSGTPISSVTSTSETIMATTSSATYATGRAYRVKVKGALDCTAAQLVQPGIRQHNLTGATLLRGPQIQTVAGGQDIDLQRECVFVNTSGHTIIDVLVLTFTPASAASTVNLTGTGGEVTQIYVEDIGAATDFPGAVSLA